MCIRDRDILGELAAVTSEEVKDAIGCRFFLPDWENTVFDFHYDYKERILKLPSTGYGMYAKYSVFHLEDGFIAPVKYPDSQTIEDLFGYERERELIIKNTEGLLCENGSNMLLYGDAGTGKSSTIKAVCNHFASKGLRLIEVKKNELYLSLIHISGPSASIFYGVRDRKSEVLEHTSRPPAAPQPS